MRNALEELRDKRRTAHLSPEDAVLFKLVQDHLQCMMLWPEGFSKNPTREVHGVPGARMGFYPKQDAAEGFLVQGVSGQEVLEVLAKKYELTLKKVNGVVWMLALLPETPHT